MSYTEGLDLVQLGKQDGMPVCKLMDYNKFMYDRNKRNKGSKNKTTTKEIRLRYNTADNDMRVKAKQVKRMLSKGNKVKITISYKGREVTYMENGIDKTNQLLQMIGCEYTVERKATAEGNKISLVLAPFSR